MADAEERHTQSDTSNTTTNPSASALDVAAPGHTVETSQVEGSSDGESERATRERLKKTTIAGNVQQVKTADDEPQTIASSSSTAMNQDDTDVNGVGNGARGRPTKKRSFEDLTRGDTGAADNEQGTEDTDQPDPKSGHHKRMRSRDVASGEHNVARYGVGADVASPVQEESDSDTLKVARTEEVPPDTATEVDASGTQPAGRSNSSSRATHNPDQTTATKLNPSSGFANASSTSPFGTAQGGPKSSTTSTTEAKPTSASAFASSGISAFASSEKSPFISAAQSSGGFGSGSSSAGFGSSNTGFGTSSFASKQSNGGFGSSTGFGSSSGFASASGFGSSKPFGTATSGFGGPIGTSSSFGTGKPFASSKDKEAEDEVSEEDAEEEDSGQHEALDEQDERFVAQDVETGEEEEQTIFACRAKLYHFEKEWKERGVGTVKINLKEEVTEISETTEVVKADEESGPTTGEKPTLRRGRLIMRTDGVHRVILNTPIFKSMMIGQADGSEPMGKTMHLTGLEDGKPRAFQIKIGKEEVIKELYWKVVDLRKEAKA